MIRLPVVLTSLAILVGCGSIELPGSPHEIRTKDGRVLRSADRPDLQEKTGYYHYRTEDGRDAVIRASQVVAILPQKQTR